jgi:sugar phosphate isomerase/epimerase
MEKHWSHYCTLSIVHFMAFPSTIGGEGPIVETLSQIAEDPFFTGIEIGWIKDPGVRAEAKAVLEQSHIQIGYGAQPSLLIGKHNLNSLDDAKRAAALSQLKENIDEAQEMGAKRIGFLSGVDPGDADRPKALELLIDSVKQASAYARDKGLALTLETFDRDVDKKCLIGPSDYAAEFASAVKQDYPEFGLMYDLSHQPLLFEESEPALTLLKDHLVHAHVGNAVVEADTPGYGDLHPRFGWPGGSNDVDELVVFLKALFKIGYLAEGKAERPWVGFEVKPQTEAETSEQIIAGTKRVWAEAWSRM